MRCNHCPFGSLGQFLQLLQRRLFGPFGPRTEFSMGSMWNVPTCSIERAQFFIPLDRRDAGIVRHPRCRGRVVFLSPAAPIFIWGFAPIDGSSFIHVTCVTCPVAGEITIRQAQVCFGVRHTPAHNLAGAIDTLVIAQEGKLAVGI